MKQKSLLPDENAPRLSDKELAQVAGGKGGLRLCSGCNEWRNDVGADGLCLRCMVPQREICAGTG